MAVSLVGLSEADQRRLAQKEKIRAVYELLQDIPEEKLLFVAQKGARDDRVYFSDPESLHWMATRIKQRITEANAAIQEALTRSVDGVLDLSRKNLCDITVKDFYAPLVGIRKIILSGNHLRTVPPVCSLKPFLEKIEAVGNLVNIETLYEAFRRDNQVSFDLFQVFKEVCNLDFEGKEDYLELFLEMSRNPEKTPIIELAHRVHALMSAHKPAILHLNVCRLEIAGEKIGGVRGYIPLNYFSHLQSLNLSGCDLESIAPFDWLSGVVHLKKLNLSRTSIEQLPISLMGKPIEELDLSHTAIRVLPDWIGNLEALKILNLQDTRIAGLPPSLRQARLQQCLLDGTSLREFPVLNNSLRLISIKRTMIRELHPTMLGLFQKQVVVIDHTNLESLRMQAAICSRFYSPIVANWVFNCEKFKREEGMLPTCMKTGVVGMRYVSMISFLLIWQICDALLITAPAPCLARRQVASVEFSQFREQRAALAYSMLYLWILYQFQPLSKRWKDIKSIAGFLKR